jgi:hypothetical protein
MSDENQPDAMALLEELEQAPEAEMRLDALQAELDEEAEIAVARAMERFRQDSDVKTLCRDIPQRVEAGVKDYEQILATADARLQAERLGRKEHDALRAKAETDLDAMFLRECGHAADIAEKLGRRFRTYPPGPASPELLAEVQTAFSGFGVKTGLQVLTEAETALQIARDEGVADHERLRQRKLLGLYHQPAVQRMATQPPRHARAYQTAFRKLQQAIEVHLDTVNGGALDRLATGFTEKVLGELDNARGAIKHMGAWDDTIVSAAAPSLWPQKED